MNSIFIMKEKIKSYFESLEPKLLGVHREINVSYVKKLGQGTSNLNYLVKLRGIPQKFIFRMNMDPRNKGKSRREFEGLKAVQHINIAPIVRVLDESKKIFDADFLILDYIEGKTVDKTKIYLKDEMIVGVANLLAKIHSIKIIGNLNKIKLEASSPEEAGPTHGTNLNYIKKHIKDKTFLKMIEESLDNAQKINSKRDKNIKLVLSQGDICEQNIIYHNRDFKLIDFEDIERADPTLEIVRTIIDFGTPFNEHQKELFYNIYLRIRKDPGLKKRVEQLIPITYLRIFLWSIQHTLKVKNKEFHEEFHKNNDIKKDIGYAKIMFKRNLRAGVIDKKYSNLDLEKILGVD